jgi:hypothetical protein
MKINPKLNLSRNNSHGSGNRNKLINRSASSVDQHSSNSDSNPNVYDKVMSNNKIHNMESPAMQIIERRGTGQSKKGGVPQTNNQIYTIHSESHEEDDFDSVKNRNPLAT